VFAGDAALDQPAEAFTGVLVDDRYDLDWPRTICSGLCRFVAMILSSLPAHNVGRKTLIHPGSTNWGQAGIGWTPGIDPRLVRVGRWWV
jgi:hypothetical protein